MEQRSGLRTRWMLFMGHPLLSTGLISLYMKSLRIWQQNSTAPSSLAPAGRILGLTVVTDLEVDARLAHAAVTSGGSESLATVHPVTLVLHQGLVVGVEAEIAIAVVDHHQQAGAAQPVGEYHAPRVHGAYRSAFLGLQYHSLTMQVAVAVGRSKPVQRLALYRPGQAAASLGEGGNLIGRRDAGDSFIDFFDKGFEALAVLLELVEFAAAGGDGGFQLRQQLAAAVPLASQCQSLRLELGLAGCQLEAG